MSMDRDAEECPIHGLETKEVMQGGMPVRICTHKGGHVVTRHPKSINERTKKWNQYRREKDD